MTASHDTIRAWVATDLSGEDGLRLVHQVPLRCSAHQLRVKVHAASLNFPDVLITRGEYQMRREPPFTPGSEAAGIVTEVGSALTGFTVGDRVVTIPGAGAFADEVLVTPGRHQVHRIPDEVSFSDAAALGLAYGTAVHALRRRAHLSPGETLLVLGASGGCGSAAVQVGAAMGARVIAAASTSKKRASIAGLGADTVIGSADVREAVAAATGGRGVDVVFDPVGGEIFDEAKRSVAWHGRYLIVGFASGGIPHLRMNYPLIKSIAMIGVAYGASAALDPETDKQDFSYLTQLVSSGQLNPMIGRSVAFLDIPDALREMRARQAVGKTVVVW